MAFKSFKDIRNSRGSGLANMLKKIDEGNSVDDRFWQPEVDKLGNGQATIRFLPAAPDNEYPWARTFNHGFQNEANGKWYIEECPTTIGQPCPCCEGNSELWNTNIKENQDIVRQRKRKLHYIFNVLVIKDSKNPENEGQVKLFKCGKKIFDKIKTVMQPQFEDETPIDPFDFWEGANFKLKICKVDGYRNYDRSEFESPSAVSDDDDEIEAIWKKEFDLREFTDTAKFKSYDDLKKQYNTVVNGGSTVVLSAQRQAEAELDAYAENPEFTPSARKETSKPVVPPRKTPAPTPSMDDEDDEAAYFATLLES